MSCTVVERVILLMVLAFPSKIFMKAGHADWSDEFLKPLTDRGMGSLLSFSLGRRSGAIMVGQFNPFRNGVDLSGNLAEKAAGEADLSWLLEVNLS